MSLLSVAVNSFTGIETIPKLIAPRQIDRGMAAPFPGGLTLPSPDQHGDRAHAAVCDGNDRLYATAHGNGGAGGGVPVLPGSIRRAAPPTAG